MQYSINLISIKYTLEDHKVWWSVVDYCIITVSSINPNIIAIETKVQDNCIKEQVKSCANFLFTNHL